MTFNGVEEHTSCPVCFESFPRAGSCKAAVCTVCKHAVCGECDKMLNQTGDVRCPLCRAPRPGEQPMPLHIAIHAFHCVDAACERPRCTEAKLLLMKIEVHVQNCAARELHASNECKVCELWRALNTSLTVCAPPAATAARGGGDRQGATRPPLAAIATAALSGAASRRLTQRWQSCPFSLV